jgi:hypothetical protein
METLKMISSIVWSIVGITMIGGTIYSLKWMGKFYRGFLTSDKKEEEAE